VVRQDVGSDHGLMPDAMTWIDDTHLGVSSSRLRAYDERAGTAGAAPEAVVVDVANRHVTPFDGSIVNGGGGGWVLAGWGASSRLRELDSSRALRLRGESGVQPVVDPAGRQVAGLRAVERQGGTTMTPAPLAVARLDSGQPPVLKPIPAGRRYYGILGWRDDTTVMATGPYLSDGGWNVFAVDIRTGAREKVLRTNGDSVQIASGLLDLPVVGRPEPPRPWDPRLVTGLAVGVVLLSGAAVLFWRRRVGP
jgi:hypothetical protein